MAANPPPGAVLFMCNLNAIRSPMAEGLMKLYFGSRVFVDSVGVRKAEAPDPFMVAVMEELGIDLSRHRPKALDDWEDEHESFDLVVTLSPQAQHVALQLTHQVALEVEFWHIFDPTAVEGSRAMRLDAYRQARDMIDAWIRQRFHPEGGPVV